MNLTMPTASTREWLARRDDVNEQLRRFVRSRGGRVRRHIHSAAYERGTIVPLGGDKLRQEVTKITELVPAVSEALDVIPQEEAFQRGVKNGMFAGLGGGKRA